MKLDDFDHVAALVTRRNHIERMSESMFGMTQIECMLVPNGKAYSAGESAVGYCEPYWLRGVLKAKYDEMIADIDRQLSVYGVEP